MLKRMLVSTVLVEVIAVVCCLSGVSAQSNYVSPNNVGQQIYEMFKHSVSPVLLDTSFGAGTILTFPFCDTCKIGGVFVVTNEHVVRGNEYAKVRFLKRNGATVDVRHIVYYKDAANDFAVLQRVDASVPSVEYDRMPVDTINFATKAMIKEGAIVYLLGYPLQIGLSSAKPVIQSGIVAFHDEIKEEVIIDVVANRGNSGGPVIMLFEDKVFLLGLAYKIIPAYVHDKSQPTYSGISKVIPIYKLRPQIERHINEIQSQIQH